MTIADLLSSIKQMEKYNDLMILLTGCSDAFPSQRAVTPKEAIAANLRIGRSLISIRCLY